MKNKRCRKCKSQIIPAWKTCLACDHKAIKSKKTPDRKEWKENSLYSEIKACEMNTYALGQYQNFFKFFGEDLQPFVKEWDRLKNGIDKCKKSDTITS